jgi:hypothetical protein
MADETKKKCFVIAPIGDEASDVREHSDTVLECLINPVLEPLGFEKAQRADHLGEPGIITRQIVERIAKDELVIADLSGHNPNVFYELAIRHASGLPFIQMIKKGEKIPFDVGQQRTISFDPKNLRDAERVKVELKKQVEACVKDGFKMETPLGYAFDFQNLKSGDAVQRSLSLVLEKLDGLATRQSSQFFNERMLSNARMAALGTRRSMGVQGPQGFLDADMFFDAHHFDGAQGPQGELSEDGANVLLRVLFPDYDPVKAREVLAKIGRGYQQLVTGINTQILETVRNSSEHSPGAGEQLSAKRDDPPKSQP